MSDKLSEALLLRGALDRAVEEMAKGNPGPYEDICRQLAIMDKQTAMEAPPMMFGRDYIMAPIKPKDVYIEGILERQDVASINAPSKSRKTWLVILVLLCTSGGVPFLGMAVPKKRKVSFYNFELREEEFRWRLQAVAKHLPGYNLDDMSNIFIRNFKGISTNTEGIVMQARNDINEFDLDMLILDPFYKMLNSQDRRGLDENSAGDMEFIINKLNALTKANTKGCTIAWVHHYSKGNKNNQKSQDRPAGSGVLSREPDTIITLSELEKEGEEDSDIQMYYRLEFTLRNFPPKDRLPVRWDPHMLSYVEDLSMVNAKLKQEGGRPVKHTYTKLVNMWTQLNDGSNKVNIAVLKEEFNISLSTIRNILADCRTEPDKYPNPHKFVVKQDNGVTFLQGKVPYIAPEKTDHFNLEGLEDVVAKI